MVQLRFDWDPRKAAANLQKHRVSFEEAQTAFLDEDALSSRTPTTPKLRIASFSWV
jgi:uncharacterized DUF497 family protein